jgi:hypothetical protein
MKGTSRLMALGVLAMPLVLTGPAQAAAAVPEAAVAAAGGSAAADQPPPVRAMTDLEKAAAGCVVSAGATTGLVYALGPSEFVMVVVGGLIVPSSSPVLFVGLLSTITSMACGAGAAFTPAVLWGWRQLGYPEGQTVAAAADPPHPATTPPDGGGAAK